MMQDIDFIEDLLCARQESNLLNNEFMRFVAKTPSLIIKGFSALFVTELPEKLPIWQPLWQLILLLRFDGAHSNGLLGLCQINSSFDILNTHNFRYVKWKFKS